MNLKTPPNNQQAEQAVIAGCLLDPAIIPDVVLQLSPSDFYREAHTYIFEGLIELKSSADLVTLSDWLQKKRLLEKCGGNEYISKFIDVISTSAGWRHHAEIIKEMSKCRAIIQLCSGITEKCYQRFVDINQAVSDLKSGIHEIEKEESADYETAQSLINQVFKDMEDRKDQQDGMVGISTGFKNLDIYSFGLEPATTTYITARPSIGKTALALCIAENVATLYPESCVPYFSHESAAKILTRRRLSSSSKVFLSRIRSGDIEDSQWPYIMEAANTLSERNLILIDKPKYKKIEALTTFCESLALRKKVSLIVVDHIQLMATREKTNTRKDRIDIVSERLQDLAKNLSVPVLVLCQLNRKIEERGKGKTYPRLDDMKESGDLEQNADNVWGLWREDKESEMARVEGLKGRDVGTFTTWLRFDRYIQRFYDAEEQYEMPVETNERGFD